MSAVPAMPFMPEYNFDAEACRIRPSTPVASVPADGRKFAIVEQMGHRRFGAEVREVEFCGAKLLECVLVTEPPIVLQIHPQSLYAITTCSEDQARKVNTPWGLPSEVRALLPPSEPDPVVIATPTRRHDPSDLTVRLVTAMSADELRAAVVHLRACFEAHGDTEGEDGDDAHALNVLLALEDHVGIASSCVDDHEDGSDDF